MVSSTCPQCAKQVQNDYKPFCSKRCQLIDLGCWLKGDYAITIENDDDQPNMMPITNA